MERYLYGSKNGIHIIDLTQTVPMLDKALEVVRDVAAKGGSVLFVGTKRQAQKPIAEAAEKSAQYFMNHRWLGGTLTNWKTVSNSIARLKKIDSAMELGTEGLTKKERLGMERDQSKLQASLGGIREMGKVPDILFVIDVNKEDLAVAEANKLGIPVVAVVDSNSSPDGIDYPIPGNDDASRAISFYCDLVARAALDGMTAQMGAAGIDIGEAEETPIEEALVEEKDSKTSNVKKIETVSDAALFVEEPVDDSDMLLNTPQEVTADAEAIDPENKDSEKSDKPDVSEVESKSS
jgi:small subunit ribosomal protein S2